MTAQVHGDETVRDGETVLVGETVSGGETVPSGETVADGEAGEDAGGHGEDPESGEADTRKAELVAAAQASWVAALTDLGGRNTLLYYKDRRTGTLDLAGADPVAVAAFLRTGSARLTRLFSDVDVRADAIRRVQVIYRKARELLEERGIRAGYLAAGMATWDELFLEPAAPVLLRGLTISPVRARHDDFELTLDDGEVNPVLLHKLASVFGAATEELAEEAPEKVVGLLERAAAAADVPGFRIADRLVIGTFTYAKLPMVRDLQAAGELLGDSDIVAAIAGDPAAQELICSDDGDSEPGALADAPEDDFSVLDADSSQRSAIETVLAGRSLVIHGPPGTGKSQTIANLIAALVARGRKVLFVAEKRAAIDAVLSRLTGTGLSGMALDIHEGTRDRLRIARDLGDALDEAQHMARPEVGDLHRRLSDRQARLSRHAAALHRQHEPWGVTPFAVQSALLGIGADARTPVRLALVDRIDRRMADQIRDELREFAHLGGFAIRPQTSPWFGAALVAPDQARVACDLAVRLSTHLLPMLTQRTGQACAEVGLARPRDYAECAARLRLLAGVAETMRVLGPGVWAADPARLAAAAGDGASRGSRRAAGTVDGGADRRRPPPAARRRRAAAGAGRRLRRLPDPAGHDRPAAR
jgi:hypothetical protein